MVGSNCRLQGAPPGLQAARYDRRMYGLGLGRVFGTLMLTSIAAGSLGVTSLARAQSLDPKGVIASMVVHEYEAEKHRERYAYVSEERSDRTGGHLWRELVAETAVGKVRYLVAV